MADSKGSHAGFLPALEVQDSLQGANQQLQTAVANVTGSLKLDGPKHPVLKAGVSLLAKISDEKLAERSHRDHLGVHLIDLNSPFYSIKCFEDLGM